MLIETLDKKQVFNSEEHSDEPDVIDLNALMGKVFKLISKRRHHETRHSTIEDDGLIGLLNLATVILKHNPKFKYRKDGQQFLSQVIDILRHCLQGYIFHTSKLLVNFGIFVCVTKAGKKFLSNCSGSRLPS